MGKIVNWSFKASESEDCEIQFGESVLLPAAEAYRRERPDYDPNYDEPDGTLQFFIALDVSIINKIKFLVIIKQYCCFFFVV